jgi:hypothetical protein
MILYCDLKIKTFGALLDSGSHIKIMDGNYGRLKPRYCMVVVPLFYMSSRPHSRGHTDF